MSQHAGIILALAIYFSICIVMGFYSMWRTRNQDTHDFLTAGGGIPWGVNSICILAAYCSGGTLMGNIAFSYSQGWGYMLIMVGGSAIGMLFTSAFVAGPLRNLRIATVPEFFRKRYHSKVFNILTPVLLAVTITGYLTVQMKVAGMLGEKILGIPYEWGVIVIAVVYVFYTAVGGMFSVTITDTFQGAIMMFVLLLSICFCIGDTTSIGDLYRSAAELRPDFVRPETVPLLAIVGGFMTWLFVNPCMPHTIMRTFTCKDAKSAKMALGLGFLLVTTFDIFLYLIVSGTGIVFHGGEDLGALSDWVFLDVIDAKFPIWFQTIVYAGIFAAVMSTVSGMLLSVGSSVAFDLIGTLKPDMKPKNLKKLSMVTLFVCGAVSAIWALNPPDLLTALATMAMGVLASSLCAPLCLGLWWKRMNKYGALAGLIGGTATWVILYLFTALPSNGPTVFAIPVSWIACIVVSLLTPPSKDEELRKIAIAHERMLTDEEVQLPD